ncbi:MAG: hypothetical protein H6873_04175 [Hyphomicrobiaceae bacterium]|nr:hypothetical protein [Hyphomicrobiaceae bacterium]
MTNILVTGARAPVALHLARLFHAAGHSVWLADTHRFPVSRPTRSAKGHVRLPPPRRNFAAYAHAVARVVDEKSIDLVVPTCEEVFFLAAARDVAGKSIPVFAPPFEVLANAHHKGRFAEGSRGLGADAPRTDLVTSRPQLTDIGDATSKVLKPAFSRFASRTLVRPDRRSVEALAPSENDPWVVQDFLPGEEICAYAIAVEGKLLAFTCYRPLYRAGLGAGVAFEPVDAPEVQRFAAGYVARTKWTGQISFDFRRDGDGVLRVIECNPRATSGLHFFGMGDGLADAMVNGTSAKANDLQPMTVPLALLVYGLLPALRQREFRRWLGDMGRMKNLLAAPGDRWLGLSQFLALGEIALIAARTGKTLQQAATDDIEWNGETLN